MYVCACRYVGSIHHESIHVNMHVCRHTYINLYVHVDGWM